MLVKKIEMNKLLVSSYAQLQKNP